MNWDQRFNSKQSLYLFLSALLFLICAIFSKGYHHFDEHFQLLEFANWKMGKTDISELPWEFHEQMRPSLQVGFVYLLHQSLHFLGVNSPFFIAFVLRLSSSILSFSLLILIYKKFEKQFSNQNVKLFFLSTFFLWFTYYIGVRFSSENWSAIFFMLAVLQLFPNENLKTKNLVLGGLFFGLAFHFRYQIAFALLGFGLWLIFIHKLKFKALFSLLFGFLLSFSIGVLVDVWFYEDFVFAPWNYLEQNIFEDKVSGFGVEPWYYYFSRFLEQGVPPLSVLVFLAFILFLFKNPKSPISWSIIPFLLVHIAIGHKELRFIFPLVYFVPYILISAYQSFRSDWKEHFFLKWIVKLAWAANVIFIIIVIFRPADPQIPLYERIYNEVGNSEATLFHIGKNPFHRVTNVKYYQAPNLSIKEVVSVDQIPNQKANIKLLVLGGKGNDTNYEGDAVEIYSTFPNWMRKLNFNGWQNRTNSWKVYRLE